MAIATLTIDIQAKVANIEADIKKLAQQTESAGKRAAEAFSGASDKLDTMRNAAAGVMAAFAGSAITSWVQGAIDGADALNDLAQQTGVAVKRMSEYRYAAQQSGTSMETLSTGFKALAKNIIDNDGALKQIGVATRDASGNLRSVDQVLDDVAQKFASYQDGAAKSALAMELFGKAGQEMVPFLNNGKDGLAELSEEAQKLGIVLDERMVASAAQFNDTLDKLRAASEGAGGRLAGQLLPALNAVAESMLGTGTQTGTLQTAMDSLAATIKTLVSGGYLVANVFDQVGNTLGAAAAGISLALDGDFEGAKRALNENFDDIGKRAQATADKLTQVWGDVPASLAAAADKAAATAGKTGAPILAKAKQDAGAAKDVYAELMHSLNKRLGEAEQLNELEKLNLELQEKKYARITPMERASLQSLAMQIDVQKQLRSEGEATLKMIAASGDAQSKALQSLDDELKKAARDVSTYGKTRAEVAELDLQLLDAEIAAERELNAEIGVGTSELLRNLEKQRAKRAEILETSRKLEQMDAGKAAAEKAADAAKEAAREWEKVTDRVNQAFHDGFVEALKDADSNFDAFADGLTTSLKAALADGLYQITAAPIVANIVGVFSGGAAAGGTAANGEAATLSNGFGVISGAQAAWAGMSGGIANAATAFATSGMGQYIGLSTTAAMGPPTAAGVMGGPATVMTGSGSSFVASAAPYAAAIAALAYGDHLMKAGWGLDNNRKGYAASAAGAVAGGVAAGASAGASAGSSVGPVGTVVGAVVGAIAVPVLDRLFGHNNKTNADAAGIQGSFDLSGFTGDQWQQFSKKGGTFRSDKRWTDTYDVSPDIDKELDSAFRKTVAKLQDMGKTLGVETSKSIDGFTHEFSLQLSENGDMSKAGEKLAAEIGRAADGLVAKMVPNIDEFARLGESASQTFSRLNQEVAATDAILLAMGKDAAAAFGGVGLASIAARENLIDLAGGLESLASKTQSFYANFYTGEEQLNLAAKQAQRVLDQGFADLDLTQPTDRKGFRELVESYGKDLSTEGARKYFNALLDLEDEYNIVAKAAESAAEKLAAASDVARQSQGSIFDAFASDAQKLDAAKKLVGDTFASIGKAVPDSAGAFLSLAQSIDPATEAGQGLIATLAKVSNAFAYTQTVARATLTGQMSEIESRMADLAARFGSLSPAARTVADDLAATQQQLAGLSDGLANLFNTAQLTDLQKLGQTVGYRDQIRGAISQINDDVFEAMLKGIARPQQIEQLKKAEADLWAGMSVVADKGQQAAKIRAVVLRRLGLESDEANSAAGKAADLAKQARQDQIDTLRTQIDGMQRMRDLAGQIADFTDNLSIGDLSPLSYADQLASAKSLFEQTLAAAQIGDTQAQSQLTGNARTYLDEARRYFASSTDYAAIYEKVTGSLKGFAAPSDSALTAAQSQLDTLAKLPDVMAAVVDNSKNDVAALQAVQLALRNGDDYLSKSIDAQTVALQKQIDALTTIASNQEAQIRQAGTAYQQMTDELKAVKAQLAAIEANGALAGAA